MQPLHKQSTIPIQDANLTPTPCVTNVSAQGLTGSPTPVQHSAFAQNASSAKPWGPGRDHGAFGKSTRAANVGTNDSDAQSWGAGRDHGPLASPLGSGSSPQTNPRTPLSAAPRTRSIATAIESKLQPARRGSIKTRRTPPSLVTPLPRRKTSMCPATAPSSPFFCKTEHTCGKVIAPVLSIRNWSHLLPSRAKAHLSYLLPLTLEATKLEVQKPRR